MNNRIGRIATSGITASNSAVRPRKHTTPITTPIKNLRPARETCEQCHWPQKFTGNLDKTFTYFQGDKTNTPYSIRLSVKIGGRLAKQGYGVAGDKMEPSI